MTKKMYVLTTRELENISYLSYATSGTQIRWWLTGFNSVGMHITNDMNLKSPGEQEYDLIFRQFYNFAYGRAVFLLKDGDEAADLVQSLFIDLWEKKLYHRLRGNIKGYLYAAIRNRACNFLRSKETERQKYENFRLDFQPDIGELSRFEQYFAIVDQALRSLPDRRRIAIKIVYQENHSYHEAAQLMGITVNTLKTHLKIGMNSLRMIMEHNNTLIFEQLNINMSSEESLELSSYNQIVEPCEIFQCKKQSA